MADARLAALDLARELERRDERLAQAALELDELDSDIARLRAHARKTGSLLERLPRERERLAEVLAAVSEEAELKRAAAAETKTRLGEAMAGGSDDEIRGARRAAVAARDEAAGVERRRAELEGQSQRLEHEAAMAERDRVDLDDWARRTAARLRATGRVSGPVTDDPSRGLGGLERWGARARGALFVARGVLQQEREGLAREASELVASALGTSAPATSVRLARQAIERAGGPPSL